MARGTRDDGGDHRPGWPRPHRIRLWAAVSGVIAAGAFLAAAELAALLVAREASPVLAIGAFVIDIVPQPVKEFAIAAFGVYDKPVLLASLGIAVVVASAIAGVLQLGRPPLGSVALGVTGVLSLAAIVTRAGATPVAWVPPVLGTVVGVLVLELLVRRLRAWQAGARAAASGTAETAPTGDAPDTGTVRVGVDRRGFFALAGVAAASAFVVGVGSRVVAAATSSIDAIREALRLPSPRTTVTVPAGAELDLPGLSPLYTPNADFYRVDTALTVPGVDPATWRLVVDGMVGRRVELTFDRLVAMGLDEYSITLTCVSNEVGGDLLGTAKWLGVPVRDILALARPEAGADMVLSRSVDGFTAARRSRRSPTRPRCDPRGGHERRAPAARARFPRPDGGARALRLRLGDEVADRAEGHHVRGRRGVLDPSRVQRRGADQVLVAHRHAALGHAGRGGHAVIAGMAWAQTVGIERVEVRIDDGDWQPATLSTPVNADTWVQWFLEWDAAPGTHYVTARAVNRDGQLQVEDRAPIAPDGSTGWQRVLVTVT